MSESVHQRTAEATASAPAARVRAQLNEILLLRRIVTRLCRPAAGKDVHLNELLREIERAMHRPGAEGELERLLINLSEMVGHGDEVMPSELAAAEGPAASDAVTDGSFRRVLDYVLDRLEISPHLVSELTGIKAEVSGSRTEVELMQAGGRILTLINQQLSGLQREQQRLTEILQNVTSGLDQVARFLTDDTASREAANDDSVELDRNLQAEVEAIDSGVRKAADAADLQKYVLSRLSLISTYVQAFRQREVARLAEYRGRVESMRSRVDALEHEMAGLQESVYRDQLKATTDPLTGVPNRLALHQRMNEEFLHWKASGVPLCVAVWDIDSLKTINDSFSHAAGDKALRIFAQHLARCLRKTDFVARHGGEEFVTIMRGVDRQDAMGQVDRIRQSLGRLGLHFDRREVQLTASCGVAVFVPGDTVEDAVKRAEAALQRAKRGGRDRCVLAQ